MAANIVTKIIEMLKMAGIDYSKMAGKIDPNKVKQLVTKTQKTVTKPKLIDALVKDKGTFGDALKIFEDEAQYLSQMNEMELANFANNLDDYFKAGGKKKNIPTENVVTTEGTPVVGKQFEKLAERKGAKKEPDTSSLQGSMEGLMSLVDEIKGISPRMRNQMDRNELAEFIQKMRGRKFTNEEIKMVREVFDEWGIGIAKDKATGMQFAKKLGARDKDEFEFITEYVDNVNTYSPKDFKEMYGTVKNINMDISSIIDKKLEKHFKKKYKWDDTKTDGGLDDITYEKYEDELYQTQKEFGDFHTMYDTNQRPNIFGIRKGTSWANHPREYLDEASVKMKEITGQGLNVDFLKNYTDDVLSKYPEPEKFQYGGPVLKGPDMGSTAHGSSELASRQRVLQPGGQMTTSTGLNYLLGEDDNNRIPFRVGKSVKKKKKEKTKPPSFFEMMSMMPPEVTFREPVNFPYKSLEDIPPNVLEMLRKDPNFDLETFLTKVGWSDPDKTRIQEKIRGEVSSGVRKGEEDEAWGLYSPMADMSFLNYQKFGKSEPIGGGLLSIKSPTDADKVQTILHEMRHGKMKEPWFWESSAVPKYVRETDHPHYSFQKYGDDDPNKFVGGEELYVRFMDQHFGDVAEKGALAGSDYKPYFDKILKDHWTPYAKRYEEILGEEKRVKDRVKGGAYGLADGGRIPFQGGGSDAFQDDFKTPSARGMSPMEAQARGLGVEHHGSTSSWNKHAGNTGGGNDNNNTVVPPESKKDPHDTAIDYIDKANQSWKAWNMINAGSMGGAAKAAFSFNPYAWAAAGLIGLDKRRKKKKMQEEGILESHYADGGRIGFAGGGMGRRGFLKFLGGTAASIAALKTGLVKLLGGKSAPEVKKVIDEVVVNNQSGAPSWFQPLVNKILREGEDAPGLAYGERQVTKSMDTPSGKVDVVYKLDSGEVELSFVGDKTALGEEVNLLYKPGRADEGTKGTPPDEFSASEAVPESHVSGTADEADWSIDLGSSEVGNVKDLASDLTELKTFATGEKATINEIVEGIKKKKERVLMDEEPSQWLSDKYGDFPYASGGLAGMLGE